MINQCKCVAQCAPFEQGKSYLFVPITKKEKIEGFRVWPLFEGNLYGACRTFSVKEFNSVFTK